MEPNRTILYLSQPNYAEFFSESFRYFERNVRFLFHENYFQHKFQRDLLLIIEQMNIFDLGLVLFLSIVLTIARHLSTKFIFEPFIRQCGIDKFNAEKIPESAWKFLFYSLTWSLCAYHLFVLKRGRYFSDPNLVWQDYSLKNPIETLAYVIYSVELSFYIHSLYTTLLVDQRRKDTGTLMMHHIVCIFLLALSYCNKSHECGLLTLFLHDGCDVLLEGTKLMRYFKKQHGRSYDWVESFVNIGFACFLLTWLSNRLYWFPMKAVYVSSIYVEYNRIPVPFIQVIVAMLWIILLMNFYWFTFALRLLYKVASGQINELEDNREFNKTKNSFDKSSANSASDFETLNTDSGEEEPILDTHKDEQHNKASDGMMDSSMMESNKNSPITYNLRQRKKINFSLWT